MYKKGYNAVNTDFQTVIGPFNKPPTYTGWHVNHYVIKSLEDYKAKRARGGGNDPNLKKARGTITDMMWFCQSVIFLIFRYCMQSVYVVQVVLLLLFLLLFR